MLVEADHGYSRTELLRDIHLQIGYDGIGGFSKLRSDVLYKLRNSNRLIIVDEAEYVTSSGIDSLRRLHDKTGGTFGLLLVGLPSLMMNIKGKKKQYAQLYSRLDRVVELGHLEITDVKDIINTNFPEAGEYIVLLHHLTRGRARTLAKLINSIKRIMDIDKCEISEEVIKEAASELVR